MTKVAILSRDEDLSAVVRAMGDIAPDLQFLGADSTEMIDAEVAICWNPPRGVLAGLSKLRLVHGVGAGIDNIISDPAYPRSVPLCRIVDPEQAKGMSEFVLWCVLYFYRGFDQVLKNQREARWRAPTQISARSCTIGIMGLGEMGLPIAKNLLHAGFRVRGWTREPRRIEGIESFGGGNEALTPFLAGIDIVVCVLPLTLQTRGLIDASFLRLLPPAAKLIHVGRGEQLVIGDVIDALNAGALGGAVIDVFESEPLRSDHPGWNTPNLLVTPHMASLSDAETLATQIVRNIRCLERGDRLFNRVDLVKGF